MDPFAGSNTTGSVAERLERRWLAIEASDAYAESSRLRFSGDGTTAEAGPLVTGTAVAQESTAHSTANELVQTSAPQ
jgi:site-specific DNA-methyltransferase (cytosine-N4-specific)